MYQLLMGPPFCFPEGFNILCISTSLWKGFATRSKDGGRELGAVSIGRYFCIEGALVYNKGVTACSPHVCP